MWVRLLTIVGLLLGFVMFLCDPFPSPPPGPEKASVELGFELPNGEQVKTNILTDTLGNKIKICMFLNLTHYLDSVVLRIARGNDCVDSTSFNTYNGTVVISKYVITLPATGNYTVTLIGYVEGQPRTVTGIITIVGRPQENQNHKPVLTVPKVVTIGAGQELVFSVYATDPDAGQQVTIDPLKKPESATFIAGRFKWTPVMADSGKKDTVIFIATDNGSPEESDTESVIIIISSTPVNLAPRWISNEVKELVTAGTTFEYDLNNKCSDPENDKLTFLLIPEPPAGDTIVGTEYIYTPSVSDTGKRTIHVVARDPSGLEDILSLELTVSSNSVVDKNPPVFTRVSPANDTAKVPSSTIQVSVLCKDDQSGVDSVKCFMGTTSFNVTKIGDSLYSATVNGLAAGWNTVSFVAKDKSPAKNACTLLVHINYEKDAVDKVPPIITFQSPSKDTVLSVDSFEVKVTCVDDSSISSVKGYRDTTAFTLKKSASIKNLWTGMAKGIAAGSYSIIKIIATDSSAAKNRDSSTIKIKYDNDKIGPVITLVNPAKDSVTTGTSSYTIIVKCVDQSGVLSVNGASGTATYTGVRDTGSLWKINLSTLENKKVTPVVLTATDSSFKANKSFDTVYVKSFIENGRTVVFMKNDDAAIGTMVPQTINSGDSARLSINTFVKSGSAFAGWAKTPTGTIVYADGANYVMGTTDDTLYAIWSKNSCTITFDKNGGNVDDVPATKVVSSGATVDALPTPPTRTGFTFAGWNTSSDGTGNAFTATTPVTISGTVFAQWTALPTFTVTYNGNGNTGGIVPADANNYTQGATVTVKTAGTLVNFGYNFVGWNTLANGSGTSRTEGSSFAMGGVNVTLYAVWSLIPAYTMTYNGNGNTGGTVPTDANSYIQGATVNVKTVGTLVRAGYEFVGWNTLANGSGTGRAEGSTFAMVGANVTLYAVWSLIPTYTVTYNGNGNTGGTVPTDANSYTQGATVTVKTVGTLVRAGYEFVGWNTLANGNGTGRAEGSTFVMGGANVTLYAVWSLIPTYTVTYNGNGNTGGTAPTDANSYTQGATVTVKTVGTLVRSGYNFVGWNTLANGSGTTRAEGSIFAMGGANVTLHAVWTLIPTYTVTYNGNGNTGGAVPTDANSYTQGANATVKTAGTLVRSGYTFSGWNTTETGSGISYTAGSTIVISSNTVLYAVWKVNCVITFLGNNLYVQGSMSQQIVPSGTTVNLNSNVFSLSCYAFSGWAISSGGSVVYNNQGSITLTSNITLYAKWQVAPLFVTPAAGVTIDYPCTGTVPSSITVSTTNACVASYEWHTLWMGSDLTIGESMGYEGAGTATLSGGGIGTDASFYCIVTDFAGNKITSGQWTFHYCP